MGDHGEVSSSSSTTASSSYRSVNNPGQPKYPYGHVTRGANKMLASYTLPGQVMRSNAVSTTTVVNGHQHHHHHHLVNQTNNGLMQPPSSFTVLTGLHHLNNSNNNSPSDEHSLPSSDIGEVDLDLWDLDINGPSVSPQSSTGGGHSPAVPPGRRSSDTSSTSGRFFLLFFSIATKRKFRKCLFCLPAILSRP